MTPPSRDTWSQHGERVSTRKCVCVCAMVTRFHSEGVCERENEGASASDSGMLMMTLINLINSFGRCVCERVERACLRFDGGYAHDDTD